MININQISFIYFLNLGNFGINIIMDPDQSLNSYKPGSLRELWSISYPLMISTLATLLMIFVDRCFLANYSIDAFNAATNAGTLAWAFLGGISVLTGMSEVFVSQFHGAKMDHKIGSAVWQSIWISLGAFVFLIPLGQVSEIFFVKNGVDTQLQTTYFKYLITLSPCYALMVGLSGFYIGRGKTRLLVFFALMANIVNIFLDRAFIFGIPYLGIPEMGIKGAAIATNCGTTFEMLCIAVLFFHKKNRIRYQTMNWKIDGSLLKKTLKVGLPPAIFYFLEIVGWALFYFMMSFLSQKHMTISSVCQSIIILLSFFYDGLSRGITAISGNYIGAKNIHIVPKIYRSGLVLQMIFSVILALIWLGIPNTALDYLFRNQMELASVDWTSFSFQASLRLCFVCVFIYMFFEGVRWILSGILTAAGDTFFLLISGSLSIWVFLLFPLYFIVVKNQLSVEFAWIMAALFSLLLCGFYLMRYRSGKWKNIELVQDERKIIDK